MSLFRCIICHYIVVCLVDCIIYVIVVCYLSFGLFSYLFVYFFRCCVMSLCLSFVCGVVSFVSSMGGVFLKGLCLGCFLCRLIRFVCYYV